MKFCCNRPNSFRVKLWTDDGKRTTEPAYTISSPGAFGLGELKTLSVDYYDFKLRANYQADFVNIKHGLCQW